MTTSEKYETIELDPGRGGRLLGEKVRTALRWQGRNLSWLAKRTGYDNRMLSAILNGDRRYMAGRQGSPEMYSLIQKFADVLGIPPDYFLEERHQ